MATTNKYPCDWKGIYPGQGLSTPDSASGYD